MKFPLLHTAHIEISHLQMQVNVALRGGGLPDCNISHPKLHFVDLFIVHLQTRNVIPFHSNHKFNWNLTSHCTQISSPRHWHLFSWTLLDFTLDCGTLSCWGGFALFTVRSAWLCYVLRERAIS